MRNLIPLHSGQLNFYLAAVDAQIKAADDNPTIGLLLCKTRNHLVAEYALSAPRGLPRQSDSDAGLDTCLPSIEQIEAELRRIGEEES